MSGRLGFDLDRVAERQGEDGAALFVLHLDPVVEAEMPRLHLLGHHSAGAGNCRDPGGGRVGHVDPFFVYEIEIVENVEKEQWHIHTLGRCEGARHHLL